MSKVRIVDNSGKFGIEAARGMDRALNKMAVDIERLAKQVVPHDQGPLHSSGKHVPLRLLRYQVRFDKEYARFQEFGGDKKRKVRRYSKPGKKAHYLRDSGRTIADKAVGYFKNEGVTITFI